MKIYCQKKDIAPKIISNFEAVYPFKSLKEYQSTVSFKAIDELQNTASRFVIQMPTGSGKTRVAMEVISEFINSSNKNVKILWLAHQKELCGQAFQCFIEVWSHLRSKKLDLYRLWNDGDTTSLPDELDNNSFIVGNFQKLHSEIFNKPLNYGCIKNNLDLIIIDEAHKAIAPTYKNVINTLSSITTKVIGLTATPGRLLTMKKVIEVYRIFFIIK